MKVWVISDTHFLHTNIVKYQNRPKNHNQLMFYNWNSLVDKKDIVIHCGDLSAGVGSVKNGYYKLKKICNNLNGKKYLIGGNHDHFSKKQYLELGFELIGDIGDFDNYLFCHYPPILDKYTKDYQKPIINKLIELWESGNYKGIIHGHQHSRKIDYKNCFNACVEKLDYKPILFEEIKNKIKD
jgi:calcineurin-like phosphoesterase family protein